jgi:hypothetical protein
MFSEPIAEKDTIQLKMFIKRLYTKVEFVIMRSALE